MGRDRVHSDHDLTHDHTVMDPRPAGILLTGGSSRRLGMDKATLMLDGETLAARAARLLSAVCVRVVEVGPGVSALPAVRESPPGSGPLRALVAGAQALATAAPIESVVLLACDLPNVASVLDALVAIAGDRVVVPVDEYGRRQYVCARYGPDALARAAALAATGERSLRALLDGPESAHVMELDGFAPGVFADIDSPADARRAGIDLHR